MYDLVLKGGTVLDSSQNLNEKLDVAITGDRISLLAPTIAATEAAQVLDVEGKLVTPGLIDIHTHVYAVGRNVNHPDVAGVLGGVTTVADAAGAGPNNFPDFSDFVLAQAQTKVYGFLSIFGDRRKMTGESALDVAGVVRVAQENPDVIKGVKASMVPMWLKEFGLRHLEAAKTAAREAGIRMMIHIGDNGPKGFVLTPPELTRKAFSMMEAGDIITHVFSPLNGTALDGEGRLFPELKEAQERGVIIDAAYGDFNFSWERADSVMAQGLIPYTIASDIEIHPGVGLRKAGTRGLLEYTAYFLHMGFSLEDVIRMTTVNAARVLGIEDRAGSLAVGREADISVLDLLEGRWELTDAVHVDAVGNQEGRWEVEGATGVSRIGTQALVPVVTIKSGRIIEPGRGNPPLGMVAARGSRSGGRSRRLTPVNQLSGARKRRPPYTGGGLMVCQGVFCS